MARQVLTKQGAFDADLMNAINANFAELYSGGGSGLSLGTGVVTALAINVGSAGAVVVNGGALGTPSSGTLTNATGLPIAGITGLGTGIATGLAANGVTAGPFTTVGSIRAVGGIVTVLTGS